MLLWDKAFRTKLRTIEAMLCLLLAYVLIRCVPFRYWRPTLGKISTSSLIITSDYSCDEMRKANGIAVSVISAARRLPRVIICLPRAMAVQWMLKRRGFSSSLIFGIAQDKKKTRLHDLHAWVEVSGKTIIGSSPDRIYHRGMTVQQP